MEIKSFLHYQTVEVIGEGLSGVVYKAWDTKQNRAVAIKALKFPRDKASSLFNLNDIKTLTHIEHPHLCNVYKVDEKDGYPFIVMELIEGKTLQQLLREKEFNPFQFLKAAIQISRGLNRLHHEKIVHGNLKPANIMVNNEGTFKLLDAGLSSFKNFQNNPDFVPPYEAFHYLSPEQIANNELTFKSDLFSLGVIFYQMLSGVLPFEGEDEDALCKSILNVTPSYKKLLKRKIPGDYILVIEKLLAKNPAERFLHTDELLVTLEEIDIFESHENKYKASKYNHHSPRQYLMISLLVVLLIIFWYIITSR
ncbi:MAG: serine/threonine protein kinase [FCB group bacterium]|nr:serine/threonine protein kinase [FCB group bacterium]